MKGSEKQVKWAEDIKAKLIGEARKSYETYMNQAVITPEEVISYFDRAVEKFCAEHDDAKWWIDNRNNSILNKIDEIVNDLYEDGNPEPEADEPKALTADDMREIGMPYFDEAMIAEEVQHQQKIRGFYKSIIADGPNIINYPSIPGIRKAESVDRLYEEAKQWLNNHPE